MPSVRYAKRLARARSIFRDMKRFGYLMCLKGESIRKANQPAKRLLGKGTQVLKRLFYVAKDHLP